MRKIATVATVLLFSGCAPKVTIAPNYGAKGISEVAVLPVRTQSQMPAERTAFLQDAVEASLRNQGFLVLAHDVVKSACSTEECGELGTLMKNHRLQGFVRLDVSSQARGNFGIGYYNFLKGKLAVLDSRSEELLAVEHQENETGGLLFASGQVIEGLEATVRNAGDGAFNALATKFVEALVAKVPKPMREERPDQTLSIADVELRAVKPLLYRVCVRSTPGLTANLSVNRVKTNLRENSPGEYCGMYHADNNFGPSPRLVAEVRSPFGSAARRELSLDVANTCGVAGAVWLAREGREPEIFIAPTAGKKLTREELESLRKSTAKVSAACEKGKFIVYRALEQRGPYEKIGETASPVYRDRNAPGKSGSFYQVVAVNSHGAKAQPVAAELLVQ